MTFDIISVNGNVQRIDTIDANNGKVALQRFIRYHAMTSLYNIHKCKNVWVMSDNYGSYIIAKQIKKGV